MKRNKFSLTNTKLASFNCGVLVPIGLQEVLPGDTFQQSTSCLLRVSPLNAPVMHPLHANIYHFYVPHRLVWDDSGGANTGFQAFITGGPAGTSAPTYPTITPNTGTGYAIGSLADYLGVPTGVDDLPHSALPFRGYSLIWNEWFRDQDLETALTIDKTDGADTTTNVTIQNADWEKDRFTTARLTTQKGTAVTLPLGTSATVRTSSTALAESLSAPGIQFREVGGGTTFTADRAIGILSTSDAATRGLLGMTTTAVTGTGDGVYPDNLYADLSTATAADVNTIREAFALQRYKENRMRFGSRYTEYLRFLGVKSSDARLQRPELLGTGRQTIQFSEVLQQAPSTSGTPGTGVGILKGHGIGAIRSNRYRRFFEEHGYVFTLMVVRPKTIYGNGLPRHWSYSTKEDIWQKELEHIGQEEILNKEIYWADTGPNDVFGYGDRYDQYRRTESSIAGEFRDTTANFWHYARIFAGDVTLNAAFVKCDPTTRVYQSTSTHQIYAMCMHSIQARRLVGYNGTPFVI